MQTSILAHGDADGICSAGLIFSRYPMAKVWITTPAGLLRDLRSCRGGQVFICDIAISERDKDEIFSEFSRISDNGELTYIDHHSLPLDALSGDVPCTKIIRDTTKSTSELTYKAFNKELDREMNRIALFGAISDYCDSTKFIQDELDAYDKRTIYMEAGLLSQALGESRGDYPFKKKVVAELSRMMVPSSIERLVSKALAATKKEWLLYKYVQKNVSVAGEIAIVKDVPHGMSPKKAAKFAVGLTSCAIGLSMVERKDYIDMSMRKRTGFHLNLDRVLRTIAPRFGGTGGGHESAAGARIPKGSIDEFIRLLAKEI